MQYDPAAYDPSYDPAYYAQTPYGQPSYAPTPYGQAPYAQTPYGPTPYGDAPYGQQYSYVQVADELKDGSSRRPTWMTLTMVCTTALILIGIVLVLLLFTGNIAQSYGTTETEGVPDIFLPPLSVIYQRPAKTASTPVPVIVTRPQTTESSSKHRTALPFTEYTPKEAERQPLVCIMGDRLSTVHQFPPDKVCDYIFYDSLYKEGIRNLLPDQSTFSSSLNTFLNDHRGYRHTTLGLGFAFHYRAMAEEDLKVRNPSPLAPFWNRGIFHAGILDTPMFASSADTQAAIASLKKINRLLDSQRHRGDTAITAMAVPRPQVEWSLTFAKDFSDLRFTPYLFISFGHYRYGDNFISNCVIMPPTRHPDDIPPEDIAQEDYYNFDLSTPVFGLRELYAAGTDTRGLVSVTLKGRWAQPQSPHQADFFQFCTSDPRIESFGSYAEVCPGGGAQFVAQLNYSTRHHTVITYIHRLRRTFVYDDERAFAEKLCNIKVKGMDVPFGIAAYDIDYDDYENKCANRNKYEGHSRLKALRKVVDYYKMATGRFNEAACIKYVVG